MDEFVKTQLTRLGFTENSNSDIYAAFKDINEIDFRGLTVQKLRHFLPNRLDVQLDILNVIEELRAEAVRAADALATTTTTTTDSSKELQANTTNGHGQGHGHAAENGIHKILKPEPTDYSSDSDVQILSSEDEEEKEDEVEEDGDSDASVKIEHTPRRPKKRANLVSSSASSSSKVPRTEDSNSNTDNGDEGNSSEATAEIDGPSSSGGAEETESSTPRLRQRRSTTFNKFFDPDHEHVSSTIDYTPKPRKKKDPDDKPSKKSYTLVDLPFIDSLERTLESNGKLPTKRNYKIDDSLRHEELSKFYDNLGKYVQRLELESWSWRQCNSSDPYQRLNWWPGDLKKILYFFCPKLEVLTLRTRSNAEGKTQISNTDAISELPKLQEVNLTNSSTIVLSQLEIILKAAKNIQRFQFTFEQGDQVAGLLNLIEKLSQADFLQELIELSIVGRGEQLSLGTPEFLTLSRSNLPKLEYLEISCGLDDVSKDSFEAVLKQFSTSLEIFCCRGTFFGSDSEYFTIVVPKMDKLRYLSIGADYEFDSTQHADRSRNLVRISTESGEDQRSKVYDIVEEKDFINFGLQMFNLYPSMETIRIGNMCTLEDLHFSNFPGLKTFHVGGPWDRMIKFPPPTSRHPNYPKIETIKIPDCIMNESLILEISRVFPNLTNVTMWLPSAQCLKRFFKTMVTSKLRELHLKTNFCFSWTLEEILIGKDLARPRSTAELRLVEKLKSYSEYKEFVRFHNIDFPYDTLDLRDPYYETNEEEPGDIDQRILFFNRQLKILEIEHVGRQLAIPKGQYNFKDSRCEFHEDKIGFETDYPLTTRAFVNGFNVTRRSGGADVRKYKITNIKMPRVESQNIHRPRVSHGCICQTRPCVCFTSDVPDNDSGNGGSFGRTTAEYKVKIKLTPSLLNKQESVKDENRYRN